MTLRDLRKPFKRVRLFLSRFWSFQPIRRPEIPKTKPKDRARTPIDAFLVSAMAKKKLSFSADAEKIVGRPSEAIASILGMEGRTEIVHRDHLVVWSDYPDESGKKKTPAPKGAGVCSPDG